MQTLLSAGSCFPTKIYCLYCLLSSLSLYLGFQFAGKCISNTLWLQKHSLYIIFLKRQQCFLKVSFIGSFEQKLISRVKLKRLSFRTQIKTGRSGPAQKWPISQIFLMVLKILAFCWVSTKAVVATLVAVLLTNL